MLLLLALMSIPAAAATQAVPGSNVSLDVRVDSIGRRSDTITVHYTLHSRVESTEPLFHFTVDAPSPVQFISLPTPAEDWATGTLYREKSVAEWAVLGDQMQPGDSSPPLRFEAVGLPTIVTFWARGYVPPPPLGPSDTLPLVEPTDPLETIAVAGKTVGIEPAPVDAVPVQLLTRIRGLLADSCELEWVSRSSCSTFDTQLADVQDRINTGDASAAGAALEKLDIALDSELHSTVNPRAYWLLRINVEFVVELLMRTPPP
jgi:hypothetical protein